MSYKDYSLSLGLLLYTLTLQSATLIFENKSHSPLLIVTGSSFMKPLKQEWVRAGVQTTISVPFKSLEYVIIYQPHKELNKMLTGIKTLNHLRLSPLGKAHILFFDPKHTTVIKK